MGGIVPEEESNRDRSSPPCAGATATGQKLYVGPTKLPSYEPHIPPHTLDFSRAGSMNGLLHTSSQVVPPIRLLEVAKNKLETGFLKFQIHDK